MKNIIVRKGLVLGIILLFVGASVVSSIDGNNTLELLTAEDVEAITVNLGGKNVEEQIMVDNEGVSSGVLDVDWWPMFHHDLSHSGYSASVGPATNDTLWAYTTYSNVVSSPAVVDSKVYIGSMDRNVYCLNADTGAKIWQYETGWYVHSSPTVVDGKVYIGSCDGKVYCLNADTGAKIWDYTTDPSDYGVYSSPAVANEKVFFGAYDHKIYCLNANTGVKIWDFTTGNVLTTSSPAVANGKVYIGSCDNNVYCLNADTGAKIWEYATGKSVVSSPSVVDGKVYIGSCDGKVYCLNADTGAKIWDYTIGPSDEGIYSSPAVVDGKVYIGSRDQKVYCLNADTGIKIWEYMMGGCVTSSPAVSYDGMVYIGASSYKSRKDDGMMICLNAETGEKIWEYTSWGSWDSSPAIADGKIYVGSRDNKVYCFGSSSENQPPEPPVIDGQTNGKAGTEYEYTFNATDPDGDDVKYYIDWGDGDTEWTDDFSASGTPVTVSHTWVGKDTYTITAKAQDEYGLEGPEGTLDISMPINIPFNFNFNLLSWLFERFPNAFPILRHMLGL